MTSTSLSALIPKTGTSTRGCTGSSTSNTNVVVSSEVVDRRVRDVDARPSTGCNGGKAETADASSENSLLPPSSLTFETWQSALPLLRSDGKRRGSATLNETKGQVRRRDGDRAFARDAADATHRTTSVGSSGSSESNESSVASAHDPPEHTRARHPATRPDRAQAEGRWIPKMRHRLHRKLRRRRLGRRRSQRIARNRETVVPTFDDELYRSRRTRRTRRNRSKVDRRQGKRCQARRFGREAHEADGVVDRPDGSSQSVGRHHDRPAARPGVAAS